MLTNLPLLNTSNNGARQQASNEGVRVTTMSGMQLLVPHDPETLHLESYTELKKAPVPVWTCQAMVQAVCDLDAKRTLIKDDRRLNEDAKSSDFLEHRETAARVMGHLLHELGEYDRFLAKTEVDRYAVRSLRPDDVVGAWRDTEIRNALRSIRDRKSVV